MSELIGKRFRTRIEDMEEDDEYGEVKHPIGSTFVVVKASRVERCDGDHAHQHHVCGQMYICAWEQALNAAGESVPAEGMWTIWSENEIARDTEEVTGE